MGKESTTGDGKEWWLQQDSDPPYDDMGMRDGLAREIFVDLLEGVSQYEEADKIKDMAAFSVMAANAFYEELKKAGG